MVEPCSLSRRRAPVVQAGIRLWGGVWNPHLSAAVLLVIGEGLRIRGWKTPATLCDQRNGRFLQKSASIPIFPFHPAGQSGWARKRSRDAPALPAGSGPRRSTVGQVLPCRRERLRLLLFCFGSLLLQTWESYSVSDLAKGLKKST